MKKILCIEDDPDLAEVIEMALEHKYLVMIANDASNLTAKLSLFLPDLILLDNYIGHLQAADVLKEIRRSDSFKEIPFILCSAHANIKKVALELSANAYLGKPFELSELYGTIEQVLHSTRPA
jgi:DNA-binding response OmpR family regulator